MDVAGAIGTTAIFPMIIGILLLVAGIVFVVEFASNDPDMHERRVAARLFGSGGFFVVFAIVAWIVAIWLGYAQGAGG
ncbi:membrane protein [Microbacterium phage Big4]|nr:membrane protein [Microbacterium phage Big4]